jgi:hypothetical protein
MPKPNTASRKIVDLPGIEGKGVAPVRIASVDKAAAEYVRERDKRCRQTPREIAAKQKLIDLLHKNEDKIGRDDNGTLRYEFDETLIELKRGEETLKVKAAPAADEE